MYRFIDNYIAFIDIVYRFYRYCISVHPVMSSTAEMIVGILTFVSSVNANQQIYGFLFTFAEICASGKKK